MFKSLKMYNFLRVQNLLLVDHITVQMWVLQFSNSVVWVFFNQLFKPDKITNFLHFTCLTCDNLLC